MICREWTAVRPGAAGLMVAAWVGFGYLGWFCVPGWIVDLATVGLPQVPGLREQLIGDVRGFILWSMLAVTALLACLALYPLPAGRDLS